MNQVNTLARRYAIECHTNTNHLYDGKPYSIHLEMVVDAMKMFRNLIPEEDQDFVEAACWVHDVIEDCRETYNDVKSVCGERVAEIAYALTNDKGRNRKERAGDAYYKGIMETKYASFVKMCDRIANMKYSKESGSRMFSMYCKENEEFIKKLHRPEYNKMTMYLVNYSKGMEIANNSK